MARDRTWREENELSERRRLRTWVQGFGDERGTKKRRALLQEKGEDRARRVERSEKKPLSSKKVLCFLVRTEQEAGSSDKRSVRKVDMDSINHTSRMN